MFLNKDNAPSFIKVCMALLYPFICTYFYDYFFKIFESISSFFMPFSDNAIFSFVGLAIMLFSPSVALLFCWEYPILAPNEIVSLCKYVCRYIGKHVIDVQFIHHKPDGDCCN